MTRLNWMPWWALTILILIAPLAQAQAPEGDLHERIVGQLADGTPTEKIATSNLLASFFNWAENVGQADRASVIATYNLGPEAVADLDDLVAEYRAIRDATPNVDIRRLRLMSYLMFVQQCSVLGETGRFNYLDKATWRGDINAFAQQFGAPPLP